MTPFQQYMAVLIELHNGDAICDECGLSFKRVQDTQRFCDHRCRTRYHMRKLRRAAAARAKALEG